ncbi:glycoside hydrolase family 26 protein [Geodermatophilus sp. SYSU D00815]
MGRRGLLVAAVVSLLVLPQPGCGSPQPLTLGVAAEDPAALDSFARATGVRAGVHVWYQAWHGTPAFDAARASAVADRGALPLLTWEPWDPAAGVEQPAYTLARIADGAFDAYVAAFARQVRDWGRPLALRFLHELNATHYPWGAGVNGNSAETAVAAYRHVREVFRREGADLVTWVWCVNVPARGYAAIPPLYPGDDDVDWVAVDGYNGGTALPWGGWRDPEELFGATLELLDELSDRPLAITEVASAEAGGDKAAWIRDLFDLALDRGVRVLVWFDLAKETDWRISSSPQAAEAFRDEAAEPGRLGPPPRRR